MIGPRGLRRTIMLILSLVLVMYLCMPTVAGELSVDQQQSTEARGEAEQSPSESEAPQEDEDKDEGVEEEEEPVNPVVEPATPSDSTSTTEGTGASSTSGSGSSNKDNKDESSQDASGIEIHRNPPSIQPETSGEGSSEGEGQSEGQSSIPKPQPEAKVNQEQVTELEEVEEDVVHSYTARWSESAFSNQTMNYRDELIIGTGATYTIDPVRDVLITVDGKSVSKLKGISVEYATSNKKYVQVDGSGHLSGVKRGSAQVTVTIQFPDRSQKQLRKSVKVVDGPKISFAPNYAVLGNNGRLDLGQYANVPLLKASPNVYANVTYSIAPVGTAKYSKVRLDKSSGKLSVTYQKPGDAYVITARTYGGEEATFTLYLGQRVQRIEIQTAATMEGGRAVVYAGQSVAFKVVAFAADGEQAARQDVDWRVLDGTAAEMDRKGKLTALKDIVQEQLVVIGAFAADGSETYATMEVLVRP